MCLNHVIRSRHCIHCHLRTRGIVFKTQSVLHLKRTSLLLINLAVADLLAGVGEVLVLVIQRTPRTDVISLTIWWSFQAFASYVSVMFLTLISLERVYAVFWPLRHHVTSAPAYINSMVVLWVIGLCTIGLSLLTLHHTQMWIPFMPWPLLFSYSLFHLSLSVQVSYLFVRNYTLQNLTYKTAKEDQRGTSICDFQKHFT